MPYPFRLILYWKQAPSFRLILHWKRLLFYCHFILMYPDCKHCVGAVLPGAAEIVYQFNVCRKR
jgi:hypothetical protein